MEFHLTWTRVAILAFVVGAAILISLKFVPKQYQVNCISPVGVVFQGQTPDVVKAYTINGATVIHLKDGAKFTTTGSVCVILEKKRPLFSGWLNTSN